MPWLRLLILMPCLLVLTGCPVPPTPPTPGEQWRATDPVTGRGFYMYVPSNYSHAKPAPIIISCHGTPPYDVSEHHIRTWKWYGEKHGYIIVAPDLVGTDGIFGDGPVSGMLENERYIMSILSMLGYWYNLDRANINITGFSGGGFPAYWVGLRHPDLFATVVAQNCNFNRSNLDGWYPPGAVEVPVMVYYGENDPATIVVQSKNAIQYLRSRGFKVTTHVIPGAGHDRHPEIAMDFFLKHKRPTRSTAMTTIPADQTDRRTSAPEQVRLRGPRPPAP